MNESIMGTHVQIFFIWGSLRVYFLKNNTKPPILWNEVYQFHVMFPSRSDYRSINIDFK